MYFQICAPQARNFGNAICRFSLHLYVSVYHNENNLDKIRTGIIITHDLYQLFKIWFLFLRKDWGGDTNDGIAHM